MSPPLPCARTFCIPKGTKVGSGEVEEGRNWITRTLCDAGSILRRVQIKERRERFDINSIRNREFLFQKEKKFLNNCCAGVYCRRI